MHMSGAWGQYTEYESNNDKYMSQNKGNAVAEC